MTLKLKYNCERGTCNSECCAYFQSTTHINRHHTSNVQLTIFPCAQISSQVTPVFTHVFMILLCFSRHCWTVPHPLQLTVLIQYFFPTQYIYIYYRGRPVLFIKLKDNK